MKKLLFTLGLIATLGFTANAATVVQVISSPLITNILTTIPGGAKVTQFVLTSGAANAASVQIYDGYTNTLSYTNGSYTSISSYVSNFFVLYTNYYGRTNFLTNNYLVDVTNTVTGTTNNFNVVLVGSSPTNQSTTFNGTYNFIQGIWVTNATVGGGAITLSVTYTQ